MTELIEKLNIVLQALVDIKYQVTPGSLKPLDPKDFQNYLSILSKRSSSGQTTYDNKVLRKEDFC